MAQSAQPMSLVKQGLEAVRRGQFATALPLFKEAAEAGNVQAQFHLGVAYSGSGTDRDCAASVASFKKAADQGYAPAQAALGGMYNQGNCVPRDNAVALMWTRKAADQGYALAQLFLGSMYLSGTAVKPDYKAALDLFRSAIDQEALTLDPVGRVVLGPKASAFYFLGLIYEAGRGVPRDPAQAVNWYQRAADIGSAEASARLVELRQPPPVKSGTINLACENNQGKILVSVDAGQKKVTIHAPTTVEYKDGKSQYVNVTETSIEFACRTQSDAAQLTGEVGANLFLRRAPRPELAQLQACLMKNRIDRNTGVWRADTANYVVTANCSPYKDR